MPLSVGQLTALLGARPDRVADPAALVTGPVVIDSRQAEPGSLFAALPGERADGHDFAATAAAAGATVVLAQRPVGVPALIVPDVTAALGQLARAVLDRIGDTVVVGITGSAGKTTTKDLAAQLIEPLGPTVSPRNSFNNDIGLPLTVLRADEQTRYLIAEMSARGAGHIARLCAIAPPSVGAVLCVGHAHAGDFGGIDAVARAKSELPAALPPDGTALLNADDPRVRAMAAVTQASVKLFGRSEDAAVRATGVTVDGSGRPAFTLTTPSGSAPVRLRLRGEHNVSNALAAAAIADTLGVAAADIAARLSAAEARSKWRMEVTERPDGVTVINDAYNANPEAMRAALATLRIIARGRRAFAVLGYMTDLGPDEVPLHEQLGRDAAGADLAGLIVVGDAAAPILAGAKSHPSWRGELLGVADTSAAIQAMRDRLRPGDAVLVKASRVAAIEGIALTLAGEKEPAR
ncbi:MAG TPA: UDP-N-acetylmuramoyl-tripeptide--D-alanyl-D-alanine ligase [Streptosporangiaceae bacterium]|nr:UDP-N-acetylmuramoyl-tripeptide--D-alanyl-D-alanine ligase [Streptosporangiaceae bacterium]